MNNTKSIGLFGYGRFGKVLADILKTDFQLKIYEPNSSLHKGQDIDFVSQEKLLEEKTIFIAVPINQFASLIKTISPKLSSKTTVLDVCSIKCYPVSVMKQHLPETVGIIATHPLFGPDSIDANEPLNFMMHSVRDTHCCYEAWKNFFVKKNFNVVEITPEAHDQFAAESQGVVHFVARFLKEAKLKSTPIDTLGFQQVLKLIENNCNDTWELFLDLQNFNPYSQEMVSRLEQAFDVIKGSLKNP